MANKEPDPKELKEEVVNEVLKSFGQGDEATLEEFAGKYEESILGTYIDEDDNYIVNGAVIRCDQMSDKEVYIAYEDEKAIIYGEGGREELSGPDIKGQLYEYFFKANSGKEEVRRLSAVHSSDQTDNGITFAVISDCICQREAEECKEKGKEPADRASIVSLGNCKIIKKTDIPEIEKRADKAKEYGTCYCLIQPALEWINPYCVESLEGKCEGSLEMDYVVCDEGITTYIARVPKTRCTDASHHNTMKWNTKEGQKEGLTLLSTLLCRRGGRITIEISGQSIVGFRLEEALQIMEEYLQGEVSEEMLGIVIPWIAENCGLTVNDMITGEFSQKDAHKRSLNYDDQIIAWTYYWNCKWKKKREEGKEEENNSKNQYVFEIDPNIVKAMIAQESSFGLNDELAKNPTRNVMQSLAAGNAPLWIAANINPYDNGMFAPGGPISYEMLNGKKEKDGDLVVDDFFKYADDDEWLSGERSKYLFNDITIIKDVIKVDEDDEEGRYMVVFDNVTTNMSISIGVGTLAGKISKAGGIAEGVKAYNGEGDPNYLGNINKHLSDMGCEQLEIKEK